MEAADSYVWARRRVGSSASSHQRTQPPLSCHGADEAAAQPAAAASAAAVGSAGPARGCAGAANGAQATGAQTQPRDEEMQKKLQVKAEHGI